MSIVTSGLQRKSISSSCQSDENSRSAKCGAKASVGLTLVHNLS